MYISCHHIFIYQIPDMTKDEQRECGKMTTKCPDLLNRCTSDLAIIVKSMIIRTVAMLIIITYFCGFLGKKKACNSYPGKVSTVCLVYIYKIHIYIMKVYSSTYFIYNVYNINVSSCIYQSIYIEGYIWIYMNIQYVWHT